MSDSAADRDLANSSRIFNVSSYAREKVAAKKPTMFLTNCPGIAKEVGQRCPGGHKHQPLLDGRAKKAAQYTDELSKAICRGLIRQLQDDEAHVRQIGEMDQNSIVGQVPEEEEMVASEWAPRLRPPRPLRRARAHAGAPSSERLLLMLLLRPPSLL